MIFICDTGPLVAFLTRRDAFHDWAMTLFREIPAPLRTCEAVLTETAYFLREDGLPTDPLHELLDNGSLKVDFDFEANRPRLRKLMARYRQMDFADACIVAMSERWLRCRVLTLDRKDFSTYRRNDRQAIDFVAP